MKITDVKLRFAKHYLFSGTEHVAHILLGDALARVGNLYPHALGRRAGGDGYLSAVAAHSVDSILAQVLDDPFEERRVEVHRLVALGMADADYHPARGAAVEPRVGGPVQGDRPPAGYSYQQPHGVGRDTARKLSRR